MSRTVILPFWTIGPSFVVAELVEQVGLVEGRILVDRTVDLEEVP
jgi:hypothetical protein